MGKIPGRLRRNARLQPRQRWATSEDVSPEHLSEAPPAKLDSQALPESAYAAADILATTINRLPEETLRDAIELVREQLGETLGGAEEH